MAAVATREKKATKTPFTIDFCNAEAEPSTKALFAHGTKSALQLSRRSKKTRRDEYLLPEDMHFSSRQLLRLFLKPKFALRRRTRGADAADGGEIDENFWAAAAAERDDPTEDMDVDAPIPFDTQFFHEDDGEDDAFVDDNLAVVDEDDLWAATGGEALRRARPENVHYAKKAKRVDVKRLKDDIWNDLRGLVDPTPPLEAGESSEAEEPVPTTPVKTFDTVIQSLRSSYPRDKMSEISTSFCFICLLHLANEEGLRIETARTDGTEGMDVGLRGYADREGLPTAGLGELERSDRIVGELQALKVLKVGEGEEMMLTAGPDGWPRGIMDNI